VRAEPSPPAASFSPAAVAAVPAPPSAPVSRRRRRAESLRRKASAPAAFEAEIGYALSELRQMDGFLAAAVVEATTGRVRHAESLQADHARVAELVGQELLRALAETNGGELPEDTLFTLGRWYVLVRSLQPGQGSVACVVLDRRRGNVGLGRALLGRAIHDLGS
jgi:hypothetical protein